MSDHYQDAIYQRFKARFPDYRVKIAWNDMKQGWVVDDPQLFTKEPEPYHKAVMVLARMPDWKPELTEYGKRNVDDLVRFAYQEMQECLGES
jgi:hypothetical protein